MDRNLFLIIRPRIFMYLFIFSKFSSNDNEGYFYNVQSYIFKYLFLIIKCNINWIEWEKFLLLIFNTLMAAIRYTCVISLYYYRHHIVSNLKWCIAFLELRILQFFVVAIKVNINSTKNTYITVTIAETKTLLPVVFTDLIILTLTYIL